MYTKVCILKWMISDTNIYVTQVNVILCLSAYLIIIIMVTLRVRRSVGKCITLMLSFGLVLPSVVHVYCTSGDILCSTINHFLLMPLPSLLCVCFIWIRSEFLIGNKYKVRIIHIFLLYLPTDPAKMVWVKSEKLKIK